MSSGNSHYSSRSWPDLCRHMASQDHNELPMCIAFNHCHILPSLISVATHNICMVLRHDFVINIWGEINVFRRQKTDTLALISMPHFNIFQCIRIIALLDTVVGEQISRPWDTNYICICNNNLLFMCLNINIYIHCSCYWWNMIMKWCHSLNS